MVEMETLGLKLYYDEQAIETATPAGKAMIHMCIVVSEFERDVIRERANQGFARAQPRRSHCWAHSVLNQTDIRAPCLILKVTFKNVQR
jgi:hypothetical protein